MSKDLLPLFRAAAPLAVDESGRINFQLLASYPGMTPEERLQFVLIAHQIEEDQ